MGDWSSFLILFLMREREREAFIETEWHKCVTSSFWNCWKMEHIDWTSSQVALLLNTICISSSSTLNQKDIDCLPMPRLNSIYFSKSSDSPLFTHRLPGEARCIHERMKRRNRGSSMVASFRIQPCVKLDSYGGFEFQGLYFIEFLGAWAVNIFLLAEN